MVHGGRTPGLRGQTDSSRTKLEVVPGFSGPWRSQRPPPYRDSSTRWKEQWERHPSNTKFQKDAQMCPREEESVSNVCQTQAERPMRNSTSLIKRDSVLYHSSFSLSQWGRGGRFLDREPEKPVQPPLCKGRADGDTQPSMQQVDIQSDIPATEPRCFVTWGLSH